MRRDTEYKWNVSLLSRYLLLLLAALLFVPVAIPASIGASWFVNRFFSDSPLFGRLPYGTGLDIEQAWHREAARLAGATDEQLESRLMELKRQYPDASLFWVDGGGVTRLQLPVQQERPVRWTADEAIAFMKERASQGEGPFTVIAFIGGEARQHGGFMVLELPRRFLKRGAVEGQSDTALFGYFLVALLLFFIVLSYLFFRQIRGRLLQLKTAMTAPDETGIPRPIPVGRPDEIGQVTKAFNDMVDQLMRSKEREREEEALRQRLIGSLSHDLRTPLTVIGGHLFTLEQEPLTETGRRSVQLMALKLGDLDRLLDHLLSYNLLANGKYTLTLRQADMLRLVRQSAAAWYPVWEKARLETELELPESPLMWEVDEQAFTRVLDNLFQNVVRHAGAGGYIGISIVSREGVPALLIADRGPGIRASGTTKGAGLGLSVVDLLLKEMKLRRETESTEAGTRVYIVPESGVF
ncbi:HAMP domain-containing sensor histidine kinase [Paenibacillus hodogayensis]|uniref:histidine kinase n=1 Tax=Paenibacillus hodogayensis TaxID=279208 RepID=A0ABV5VY91_9BACL